MSREEQSGFKDGSLDLSCASRSIGVASGFTELGRMGKEEVYWQ